MSLQQFFLVLRARYKLALLTLLGTVAVTLAVSLLLPARYTALTAVMVDIKTPDPIAGVILPAVVMPGYMATQVDIVNSDRVARKIIRTLRLHQDPQAKAQWLEATKGRGTLDVWLAELLQKNLDVKPSLESNIINIAYTGVDPSLTAAIANAFTQAYIDTTIELKVEPAKQYAQWFGEQGKTLRNNLEKAQNRLSAYQQSKGIVASDERLDNETAKLNEISTQLTIVQAQTADAQSKQESGNASDTLPEVVQNSLIWRLKSDIARQEAKLQAAAGDLGKNHPQFQNQESEIASLKSRLETETQKIASGFSTSRAIGKDKEAKLRTAIAEQRKKLLQLKRDRDEAAVLTRDVEAAQKAYEAVSQRFNQTSLESQSTHANVSVLTPATVPIEPSFPKVRLNILLSIFLGTLLGVGAALMREILDRRIRSVDDLAEIPHLPVLGVLEKTVPRRRLGSGHARLKAP